MMAECRDTAVEALAAIKKDGAYTVDKYGQRRSHPAATVLRDARAGELSALRQLHLDMEPIRDVGRPGGA